MDQLVSSYCHTTPGRIRVRVTGLKGKESSARSLELLLAGQPHITHVRASHLTSNVLVKFDHREITHEDVLVCLEDLGHLPVIGEAGSDGDDGRAALSSLGMLLCGNLAKAVLKHALKGTSVCLLVELF